MAVYRLSLREDVLLLGNRMRHLSHILTPDHPELNTAIAAFARAKILYENSRPDPKLRRLVCHCEAFDRYREKVIAMSIAWRKMEMEGRVEEADEAAVEEAVERKTEVQGFTSGAEEEGVEHGSYQPVQEVELDDGAEMEYEEYVDEGVPPDVKEPVGLGVLCYEVPADLEDDDDDDDGGDEELPDDTSNSSDDSWVSSETDCTEDDCGCELAVMANGGREKLHICHFDHARAHEFDGEKDEDESDDGRYDSANEEEDEVDGEDDDYDSDFEEMTAEMQKLIIAIPWQSKK